MGEVFAAVPAGVAANGAASAVTTTGSADSAAMLAAVTSGHSMATGTLDWPISGLVHKSVQKKKKVSASDRHRIGPSPRFDRDLRECVDAFIVDMAAEERYVLGFPGNLDFRFSEFAGLLDVFVNNVGDPDSSESSAISAKAMERAVVEFMARLANGDSERTYGYVAAGGSEANLFGLDRGCELLPEARVYCSRAAHYSIHKSARLMRKELVVVDCDDDGRIDPEALARSCRDDGSGAVVVATIGTTMSGANDEVDSIIDATATAGPVYIHVDAALGGLIVPFTPLGVSWGFARREVGSVAVSMHKALGMPIPCAVALCRSGLVLSKIQAEYIGATDSTLACSRSGIASVLIWYSLASKGITGLADNARKALETADYAAKQLADIGLQPVLHPASITVVFDRPSEWICRKYHLATEGRRAHIVTVSHVSREVIDELCLDVSRSPI